MAKEKNLVPKKKASELIWKYRYLYIMLIPFFLWYIFFYYLPLYGILIAFKDYKPFLGIWGSPWVGFKHFVEFFQGPYWVRLVKNTVLINVYRTVFTFPIPIILAILFNELRNKKYMTVAQTVSYLPHFISSVVVAGIVVTMLSPSAGIVNQFIEKLGGEKIYFLTKPKYFKTIYITMGAWQSVGFSSIIYTAAICGIDETLYEAAMIDGASRFQRLWHVTVPGIVPTIAIMLITRVGNILSEGSETIILLYQPITYETADVISTYTYRQAFTSANPQYSFTTAIGLLNGVIALILTLIANYISKKTTEASLV